MATASITSTSTRIINTLYRVLRQDEWTKDEYGRVCIRVEAKNPKSEKSVEEHVSLGSSPGFESKFISTSMTYEAAIEFASHTRNKHVIIVEINAGLLKMLPYVQIIDVSNDDALKLNGVVNRFGRNCAKKFQEVLIVINGYILCPVHNTVLYCIPSQYLGNYHEILKTQEINNVTMG